MALAPACDQTRNVGSSNPHPLPVGARSAVVLVNDSVHENWQGEYAILLSRGGGPKLVGIVVNTGPNAGDLEDNVAGWRALIAAARNSHMGKLPDPTASVSSRFQRPASGKVDDAPPLNSEGGRLIVEKARELGFPYHPLAVVTGGRLTDVADAYLMDHTIADRVVVVSSLGTATDTGGLMGQPNGEADPVADAIVTAHFPFVQVSAYYDQTGDVPAARLADLPANDFGAWIAAKQAKVWSLPQAADQVAILAVGLETFVTKMVSVTPGAGMVSATAGPNLVLDPNGKCLVVAQAATRRHAFGSSYAIRRRFRPIPDDHSPPLTRSDPPGWRRRPRAPEDPWAWRHGFESQP
jgi:hypothetical protein